MFNKIKNWGKKKLMGLAISVTNVEKETLGMDSSTMDKEFKQVSNINQGRLMDSLVKGEITQEVKEARWRMYKILRRMATINGEKIRKKNHLEKVILDPSDRYPLEMVVYNHEIENHHDSEEDFDKRLMEFPIKVGRSVIPKFNIEKFTYKLNVRKISDTKRLLEFNIPLTPEMDFPFSNPLLIELEKESNRIFPSSLVEINNVSFVTHQTIGVDDYYQYSYKNLTLNKIIKFHRYVLVKFTADVDVDGLDIFEQYRVEELDLKYENKERRKNIWS